VRYSADKQKPVQPKLIGFLRYLSRLVSPCTGSWLSSPVPAPHDASARIPFFAGSQALFEGLVRGQL